MYKDISNTTKRYKAISAYTKFINDLMEYSEEIIDLDIRNQYVMYLLDMPIGIDNKSEKDIYSIIDNYKKEIQLKFRNHIPSLIKESRDKKLEKLLK